MDAEVWHRKFALANALQDTGLKPQLQYGSRTGQNVGQGFCLAVAFSCVKYKISHNLQGSVTIPFKIGCAF